MSQSKLLLNSIKSAVTVYDALTLPAYAIAQRPWTRRPPKYFGHFAIPSDPSSSLINSTLKPSKNPLSKYPTMNDMIRATMEQNDLNRGLGTRPVYDQKTMTLEDGKTMTVKNMANEFEWITYGSASKRMDNFAKGLQDLSIKPGDNVAILLETRKEWLIAAHGLLRSGASLGSIYSTLGRDGITYAINNLGSKVLVTSIEHAKLVLSFAKDLPTLKTLIIVDDTIDKNFLEQYKNAPLKILNMTEVEGIGESIDKPLAYNAKPDDVALIMYTSGSSGVPKGVVLLQKQFVYSFRNMDAVLHQYGYSTSDPYVAYLPLAHMFEFFMEILCLCYGSPIGYGSPFTLLTGSPGLAEGCVGDVNLVKPTGIAMVPLMLDKIKTGIMSKVNQQGPFATDLFNYAVKYKTKWIERGYQTPLCDKLIFAKAREALGGNLREMIVGAAPLSEETQQFIKAVFNITLQQGYAASESIASGVCMSYNDLSYGRCGAPIHGVQIRFKPWEEGGYLPSDKPNPRGEIWIGGDIICQRYHNQPEETRAAIIQDETDPNVRWFASGDIGEVYPDGTIKIIDRKKDLIKLANGEFVSLGKIEAALITSPLVENICLHADSMNNHIVALIQPNRIELKRLLEKAGHTVQLKHICENDKANQLVYESITKIAKKNRLSVKEVPVKIHLCKEDWTPQTGLVTATMKIRRKQLCDYYRKQIDNMYV